MKLQINCDGGARGNPGPAACAFVAQRSGEEMGRGAKYLGVATNNNAEYQGVMLAFEFVSKLPLEKGDLEIDFYLDSQLVVRQLTGEYKIKNEDLLSLSKIIKKSESIFKKVSYFHIPRKENSLADLLVNKCLDEKMQS